MNQVENIVFKSVFFVEHSKMVSIKTNPLLLNPNEIKPFEQLIFESTPLPVDISEKIRDGFIEDIKILDSVHAKFRLISGESIEKEVKILQTQRT